MNYPQGWSPSAEEMLEIGRLLSLRDSIGASSYREPIAILAPPGWIGPHLLAIYGLPVWKHGAVKFPSLVYGPTEEIQVHPDVRMALEGGQ